MINAISAKTSITPRFKAKSKTETKEEAKEEVAHLGDDNPISRKGETMNLIKATFVGGIVLGGKLLFELVHNGDFVLDTMADFSSKNAEKKVGENPNMFEEFKTKLENGIKKDAKANKNKKILYAVGTFVALLAAGLCGFALLYTLYNAPKIAYQSKVNAFKKGKEMDVYIKANDAEKNLYEQLDEKAKNSDKDDKEKLKAQYLQLKNAKNQVPDYVKLKR